MKLYSYFRSSAAYRVRIALNLKGLTAEAVPVHLRRGEQHGQIYRSANPFGLVPVLEHEGHVLSQSLAIIEYLEEIQPAPPLLPAAPVDRAFVRSLALSIACDIHPLNNLRVLDYLRNELAMDSTRRDQWYAHWIETGLTGLEALLARSVRVGPFCLGDAPTLADVCLVPQMYNAERMKCNVDAFPLLRRVAATARRLEAFRAAEPERQPDAE